MTVTLPDLAPSAPSRTVLVDAVQLGEDAPKSGHVDFTLLQDLRVLSTGRIIAAGSVRVHLSDGKGRVRLPQKSSAVTDDCGDDWVILVKKSWASPPYAIQVPAGTSDLMLGDLAPARPLNRREQQWAITAASVSVETLPPGSNAGGTVTVNGGTLDFRLRVPRGEQGLPGPGALAADDAVSAYIQQPSATSTALDRVYRRGYSPREFGVVGNGTTDDTAAWNDALDTVPAGSTFTCPEGDRYKLTGPLNLKKAVTIEGGEFLPRTTGRGLNITASDVTIRGSKFTSSSAAKPDASHQIIAAVGTSSAPLRRVTVDKVIIDKSRHQGVRLEWCEDVKVTGCTITDFQYGAVMLISVTRAEVSGCIIRNGLQEGGLANAYGIAATDLVNTVAGRSKDILITRNVVDNIPRWEGIDTHGGERITITDNIVTRCRDGIAAVAGNKSRATAPKALVVSGNTIDSLGIASPRSAIRLYGITDGPQASAMVGPNTIRGGYAMDVEAARYESTTITAQATSITNGYSSHPAPYRSWAASTNISRTGDNATRTVSLPAGVFTQPPMVFLTPQGGANPANGWTWRISAASKDEITIAGNGPSGLIDIQMGIYCVQMGNAAAGGVPRN